MHVAARWRRRVLLPSPALAPLTAGRAVSGLFSLASRPATTLSSRSTSSAMFAEVQQQRVFCVESSGINQTINSATGSRKWHLARASSATCPKPRPLRPIAPYQCLQQYRCWITGATSGLQHVGCPGRRRSCRAASVWRPRPGQVQRRRPIRPRRPPAAPAQPPSRGQTLPPPAVPPRRQLCRRHALGPGPRPGRPGVHWV